MRAGDRIPTPDERQDQISDYLNKMIERIDCRFPLAKSGGVPMSWRPVTITRCPPLLPIQYSMMPGIRMNGNLFVVLSRLFLL